ncbi:MAG: CpaF family protein [Alphaproteobacteria bacterium]
MFGRKGETRGFGSGKKPGDGENTPATEQQAEAPQQSPADRPRPRRPRAEPPAMPKAKMPEPKPGKSAEEASDSPAPPMPSPTRRRPQRGLPEKPKRTSPSVPPRPEAKKDEDKAPEVEVANPSAGRPPLETEQKPSPSRRKTAELLKPKETQEDILPTLNTAQAEKMSKARDQVMADMKDAMDLSALANMDKGPAREEIQSAVDAILQYRSVDLSESERSQLIKEICDEVLGYGPLEPLLARDDIADIMVNGAGTIYIEAGGRITRAPVQFRDNQHLLNICQRIVSAVGRRVDESSPICDARLPDGSRVNVIVPPLAVRGPTLTIRKFQKEKLTLEKLVDFGSVSPACAKVMQIAAACRTNILISGGTGSGKTTMLNCLTRYFDPGERIVTCEDACELQLQQNHVVPLETRPANAEGKGEATMRDLVKNCLRMRPDRIIVGEVRGPEAFDLLQAMNTGHDGSMGTIHANTPRECISRVENMIAMGGFGMPTTAVREQIAAAVGLIVQIRRLRDGSRKVTYVTEVMGMEGEVVTLQDLFKFEFRGEDRAGKIIGNQVYTGVRPSFYEQAKYHGLERELVEALEEAENGG